MGTRKHHKLKKSKKRFRKTRSKRQRGGADECPICTEALNDNCITTDCGHKFDRECLRQWCKTSPNDTKCPICREPISNTCMELNPSLFWASWNGHVEIVTMLLDNGADVNAKNNDGNTALMLASKKGQTEIVSMLLAAGADVNAKVIYGNTALIVASGNGHKEIVAILLEKGADVNIKSDFGGTALMLASLRGHTEIVAKLLEKGADVNAENNYGQTALSLASLNGHTDIVKLLKQYIVAQTLPRHLERQQNRLQVGRVMDSKKMPGDLTHKIITEHFGGKRKTRKSKKSKRKRKTRRK